MEMEKEVYLEPVSPTGQYLSNSNILSLSIICVLESEIPIDDNLPTMALLQDLFLPINPRFSSIMVVDENGEKRWKKVEVNLIDHVNVPTFPSGMKIEFYDKCFDDYLTEMAMENLPENRPLWEIHIIKYPTSRAAGNFIFKLHHSLGDGFSLMGALLSCLQRADNPSLPLTFPQAQSHINKDNKNISICRKTLSSVYNTISDLCSSIIRSSLVEDDKSPIRSENIGIEFLPVSITTMSFSLNQIKQIKTKLGVTVNDVITGAVFLGTRLYMEAERKGSGNADSTSLALLNTRMFGGYKSVEEMAKPDAKHPWGNHFTFLSVSVPKLTDGDPLEFVRKVNKMVKKKRTSFGAYLTAIYLQLVSKFRGPQAGSRYLYCTLKNSSMTITNVMGPLEKMALASHPIKGFYFVVTGSPQSMMMGVVSYMGQLRVAMLVEKGFIDSQKLRSHIETAFDMIFRAISY